jgi:hypothetical protein
MRQLGPRRGQPKRDYAVRYIVGSVGGSRPRGRKGYPAMFGWGFGEADSLNPVIAFLLLVLAILMNVFLFLAVGPVAKEVSWFAGIVTGILLAIAWRGFTSENV